MTTAISKIVRRERVILGAAVTQGKESFVGREAKQVNRQGETFV